MSYRRWAMRNALTPEQQLNAEIGRLEALVRYYEAAESPQSHYERLNRLNALSRLDALYKQRKETPNATL